MAQSSNDTEYSLNELLDGRAHPPFNDADDMHSRDPLPVHMASLAEKKRLWWRNSFINAFFIASWYGGALSRASCTNVWIPGSSSPLYSLCTTSGCSRRSTSASHILFLSPRCISVCSFFWHFCCELCFHNDSDHGKDQRQQIMGEYLCV